LELFFCKTKLSNRLVDFVAGLRDGDGDDEVVRTGILDVDLCLCSFASGFVERVDERLGDVIMFVLVRDDDTDWILSGSVIV
jgi:hypothetical protein